MWIALEIITKKAQEFVASSPYFPAVFHMLPETVVTAFSCIGLEHLIPHSILSKSIFSIIFTVIIYTVFLHHKRNKRIKLKEQKKILKKEKQKMRMAQVL